MTTDHAGVPGHDMPLGGLVLGAPRSRVAEITLAFWVVKILSTGMGETTSDFFVRAFDPVPVVLIGGMLFVAALGLQLLQRTYVPVIYWLTVVMVSVFGTMVADVIHVVLGISYLISTIFFAVALATVFGTWLAVEKTLSIHSVTTFRRELFYWATVITTFALGTATGDLTATTFHLGYLASGLLFVLVFAVPVAGRLWFGLNPVIAFWFAYVATRPLGASFADWMGVTPDRGGLDWGTGPVSVVLGLLIAAIVVVMQARSHNRPILRRQSGPGPVDDALDRV